ncbi:MAG TPA: hypothetical protein VJ110_02485 [Candidatus Nanoarchaeia archaeon]|nr:hypothetical protein [Candidatus Nanoarchaeia archaeon]
MKTYEAKYSFKAMIYDGAWMGPVDESDTYKFEAKDDNDARVKAEEYKPQLLKKFFSPENITLESRTEARAVPSGERMMQMSRPPEVTSTGFHSNPG